jgi:RNA polymerase sigma-70 factor (ECF subfamily)
MNGHCGDKSDGQISMISVNSADLVNNDGESNSSSPGLFPVFTSQVGPSIAITDDDALLVSKCQNGDLNAFSFLVDRHEQRVRSIVSRILNTSADNRSLMLAVDIDDLSQEIFVQAWRALPRFRREARFSTWLYRIAVNRALKEYNHRRRGSGRFQGVPVSDELLRHLATVHRDPNAPNLDPEGVLQERARDQALRTAIDELPEKQRLVILLHYFEDCSCEEISTIAACSVGTVWSRLHYACRRLQERLKWLDPGVDNG